MCKPPKSYEHGHLAHLGDEGLETAQVGVFGEDARVGGETALELGAVGRELAEAEEVSLQLRQRRQLRQHRTRAHR